MTLTYKRIVGSDTFTFLVGSEKKRYTLHKKLVAYHSEPLDVLMNGSMSEAKQNFAKLKDVEEDTFVRFCQYVYTGDYGFDGHDDDNTAANADNRATLSKESGIEAVSDIHVDPEAVCIVDLLSIDRPDAQDAWLGTGKREKIKGKSTRGFGDSQSSLLWNRFKDLSHGEIVPPSTLYKKKNAQKCFGKDLLCHAQVYVFAEEFHVKLLKQLSLSKLHQSLIVANVVADDAVELLKYVYENTVDLVSSDEKLRKVVVHYAACLVDTLKPNAKFQSLLANKGELGRDFVNKLTSK